MGRHGVLLFSLSHVSSTGSQTIPDNLRLLSIADHFRLQPLDPEPAVTIVNISPHIQTTPIASSRDFHQSPAARPRMAPPKMLSEKALKLHTSCHHALYIRHCLRSPGDPPRPHNMTYRASRPGQDGVAEGTEGFSACQNAWCGSFRCEVVLPKVHLDVEQPECQALAQMLGIVRLVDGFVESLDRGVEGWSAR